MSFAVLHVAVVLHSSFLDLFFLLRQGNLPPDAITCDGSRHKGICADSLSDSRQYGGFARTAEVIFLY